MLFGLEALPSLSYVFSPRPLEHEASKTKAVIVIAGSSLRWLPLCKRGTEAHVLPVLCSTRVEKFIALLRLVLL